MLLGVFVTYHIIFLVRLVTMCFYNVSYRLMRILKYRDQKRSLPQLEYFANLAKSKDEKGLLKGRDEEDPFLNDISSY